MNAKVKLTAYAVLILLVLGFGCGFASSYSAVSKEAADAANDNSSTPANTASTPTNATNTAGSTNQSVATAPAPAPKPPTHSAHGRMISFLAALVLSIIGLGILIAYDVTHLVGSTVVDVLLDDRGQSERAPEYEKAEEAWAAGKFLEAIQMMREFLKENPREQYAALRIAEIYEKDLGNFLAAALEYEEVLKFKLPAERWGWAAIHLCNLYSKLGQQEKTRALLQRIADDYPKTSAAKKARKRLGIAEPGPEPEAVPSAPAEEASKESGETPGLQADDMESVLDELAGQEAPPPPPPPPKSNLPPGFRPKN